MSTKGIATFVVAVSLFLWAPHALAQYEVNAEELVVLHEVNAYRAQHGLSAVVLSPGLTQAADFHSRWMMNNNCFSHQCGYEPDFGARLSLVGYAWRWGAGENIAAGNSGGAETFLQWVNSPPHRANLLDPRWRAMGISRTYSAQATYRHYWTLDFGDVVDGDLLTASEAVPLAATRGEAGLTSVQFKVVDLAGNVVFESVPTSPQGLQWRLQNVQRRLANGVYFVVLRGQRADGAPWRGAAQKLVVLN